jgi:hypothetical protein
MMLCRCTLTVPALLRQYIQPTMPTHGAAVADVMMSTQHLRHGYTDENLSGPPFTDTEPQHNNTGQLVPKTCS